jgi:hypothetical protein
MTANELLLLAAIPTPDALRQLQANLLAAGVPAQGSRLDAARRLLWLPHHSRGAGHLARVQPLCLAAGHRRRRRRRAAERALGRKQKVRAGSGCSPAASAKG